MLGIISDNTVRKGSEMDKGIITGNSNKRKNKSYFYRKRKNQLSNKWKT